MEEQIRRILGELDDINVEIGNNSLSGKDVYEFFRAYRNLVAENWPNDLADSGNWRAEMESVLNKLESTQGVSSLSKSSNLKSYRKDAQDVISAINTSFEMYVNNG